MPRSLKVHPEIFQYAARNTIPLSKQTEEDVFGSYVSMIEGFGFSHRQSQDLFHTRV